MISNLRLYYTTSQTKEIGKTKKKKKGKSFAVIYTNKIGYLS